MQKTHAETGCVNAPLHLLFSCTFHTLHCVCEELTLHAYYKQRQIINKALKFRKVIDGNEAISMANQI